eukprot:tig00021070_g17916.t1
MSGLFRVLFDLLVRTPLVIIFIFATRAWVPAVLGAFFAKAISPALELSGDTADDTVGIWALMFLLGLLIIRALRTPVGGVVLGRSGHRLLRRFAEGFPPPRAWLALLAAASLLFAAAWGVLRVGGPAAAPVLFRGAFAVLLCLRVAIAVRSNLF